MSEEIKKKVYSKSDKIIITITSLLMLMVPLVVALMITNYSSCSRPDSTSKGSEWAPTISSAQRHLESSGTHGTSIATRYDKSSNTFKCTDRDSGLAWTTDLASWTKVDNGWTVHATSTSTYTGEVLHVVNVIINGTSGDITLSSMMKP